MEKGQRNAISMCMEWYNHNQHIIT